MSTCSPSEGLEGDVENSSRGDSMGKGAVADVELRERWVRSVKINGQMRVKVVV